MSDYEKNSTKYGLKSGEFDHLNKKDKRNLMILICRISERSYRRGVQQTLHLFKKGNILESILSDPHGYRYEKSLEKSYGLDGFQCSSLERLRMEEDLQEIGLDINGQN